MVTLKTGVMFTVPVPHDPADDREDDVDATGAIIKSARDKVPYVAAESFKKEIAEYVKRKKMLQVNLEKAFAIIFGQCTYALQQKLEAHRDWKTIYATQNVLDLLETIKMTTYKFVDEKYLPRSISDANSLCIISLVKEIYP